jgi:hypothetical protein
VQSFRINSTARRTYGTSRRRCLRKVLRLLRCDADK